MNIKGADLRELRLAITAAAALVLSGIGCVVVSDHYLTEARTNLEAAKQQRAEAQKRVDRVAEEEREIRQNLVYYNRMLDHGMGSEESRLDFIESIKRIKDQRQLFEIRYNIEPQKPLQYPGIRPAGTLDFYASRMTLEMQLLHEEDLLGFLVDLESLRKGYVSVRSCSLARESAPAGPLAVAPRLQSECQVDLVALRSAKLP